MLEASLGYVASSRLNQHSIARPSQTKRGENGGKMVNGMGPSTCGSIAYSDMEPHSDVALEKPVSCLCPQNVTPCMSTSMCGSGRLAPSGVGGGNTCQAGADWYGARG